MQKYQTYTNYHREKERVFVSAPQIYEGMRMFKSCQRGGEGEEGDGEEDQGHWEVVEQGQE